MCSVLWHYFTAILNSAVFDCMLHLSALNLLASGLMKTGQDFRNKSIKLFRLRLQRNIIQRADDFEAHSS